MLVLLVFGIIYTVVMLLFLYGSRLLTVFSSEKDKPSTQFTIVIPFRNEAKNLPKLLASIKGINYPSGYYEIVFIDDASKDDSVAIISEALKNQNISFDIITNNRFSASPKKDAITAAVKLAKYEWILTTDADCTHPANWLLAYDVIIKKRQPQLVAGPICFESNGSLVQEFQQLDGFSLQLATMGGFGLNKPMLCNGANLAYRKEAFNSLDGFASNNHIASGDDIFILDKINISFPGQVEYLKSPEAIVVTQSLDKWSEVIRQRIRWASKTGKQKEIASKVLGMLIFLTNTALLIATVLVFFSKERLMLYLIFLLLKVGVDFVILKSAANFFERRLIPSMFILSSLLYPIISTLVVFGSFFGTYEWKGRKFEKNP